MGHRIVAALVVALTTAAGQAQPIAAQSSDLGSIEFPTSGDPAAQEHFVRGVLLLHSFEYEDAAEAFREAQKLDADFAMAYWGEAMTYNHPLWWQQDREAALAALERLAPTREARLAKAGTGREKGYLAAVEVLYGAGEKKRRDEAYAEAMRRLHERYPADDEAKLFYALAILGTAHEGRDFATYMRAAALAEEVFRDNPHHPGAAHYLIHSYDDPIHAPLGLRAARAYSKIAPAASHAQHMISHIFVALGMWDEVVTANEIAWRVADERMRRKGLSVDARNFHALHWLAYGYLQQGRYSKVREMLGIMGRDAEKSGSPRARAYFASMRADYVVNTRRWAADVLEHRIDLEGLGAATVSKDRFAAGVALLKQGEREAAERVLTGMQEQREESAADYEGDDPPHLTAAHVMEMELQALLMLGEGREDEAVAMLQEATELEAAMPYEYGPPDIVKPSHELLGEVLLELGRWEEAQEMFEAALERAPRRTASLLGLARAADAIGDELAAAEASAELQEIWRGADDEVRRLMETASR